MKKSPWSSTKLGVIAVAAGLVKLIVQAVSGAKRSSEKGSDAPDNRPDSEK